MERVEVYAILVRHFSGEEAEAIINYIDEKKTGTASLHALKELELKIMEKIYKLKEKSRLCLYHRLFPHGPLLHGPGARHKQPHTMKTTVWTRRDNGHESGHYPVSDTREERSGR